MHRPKHIIEYSCVRALAGTFNLIPARIAYSITWAVAWMAHYAIGFRRRTAIQRIREVFGDELTLAERKRIAWKSWLSFCYAMTDVLRVRRLTPDGVMVSVVNAEAQLEYIRSCAPDGSGLVIAAPHSGSWDYAGVACHLCGLPMFFMARRQKNPLVDNYLNRMRGVNGIDTVLNDTHALRQVIRRLKAGKILAILPDARLSTPSLSIRFLGGIANLGAGAAMFSRQAGVPILPFVPIREKWNLHRWHLEEVIHPDPGLEKREDWLRMTQRCMATIEPTIRKHPESYFWYNKRWVLDPLPDEASSAVEGTPPS
jgi:KDO2-lipid IV(A) lauroyltransferase